MGVAGALSGAGRVDVFPGGEASCSVRVRNTGTVVDQLSFEVVGAAGAWAVVEPAQLSLFPGAEEEVRVFFRPPRDASVPAGALPFGVRVSSREDPQGSTVEEGVVTVAPFSETFAELIPRTSRGRRRARHQLAVDNRGNSLLNATLTAVDPDELLDLEVEPPSITAEPNTASLAAVKVRPKKTFWRGSPVSRPFQVLVQPSTNGDAPVVVDGTMLQEPLVPRWLPRALLLGLLALLVLLGLWFAVLRPTVQSAARDAAEDVAEQAARAAAQDAVSAALGGGATGTPAGGGDGDDAAAGPTIVLSQETLGDPFDSRLQVRSGAAGRASDSFTVDDDTVFSLTDVVLQNPQGDQGILRLLRGSAVILEVNLANFRDLDYHFVSPIVFTGGQEIVLAVECANDTLAETAGRGCSPSAYVAGFVRTVVDDADDAVDSQ